MRRTKLNQIHKNLKGKMIDFFGWEMPVQYKGIIDEHLAVRNKVGLFDVSHMGEMIVSGKQPFEFVQYLTPNDVSQLSPGKAQYSALTTQEGTFVDDLLVYCLEPKLYLLVVNASNIEKDYAWLLKHRKDFDVTVENKSEEYTQLALQGPRALEMFQPLTDIKLDALNPFEFEYGKSVGEDCLISRTGYTGEDGVEIYTLSSHPEKIWEAIMDKGKDFGILPVGLGARDTLRLEAKLMLYGNDIDETTTVLEAGLRWLIKFKKGDFMGREALLKQKREGIKRRIVGFEVLEKGIARHNFPVYIQREEISKVNSGSFSPYLKKSIGLTYLPVEYKDIGTEFEIGIRNKKVKARVVKTPFYKR